MCCFSRPVEIVSDTNIFARADGARQYLVYSMKYAARSDLAMVLPLPAICLASFGLGVFIEMMMVQWTVTMARNIPPDKLARVSSYDVLGSVMAMPAGALIAGPLGTAIGAARAQYAAAAVIVIASALALIPRDVRTFRSDEASRAPVPEETTAALEAA